MIIPKLQISERAAVILGAGASRGASFVRSLPTAKPPLDVDFFHQIQLLTDKGSRDIVNRLLSVAREQFGPDLRVTMEAFFTQIEFLNQFHKGLKLDRGRQKTLYEKGLKDFKMALYALLQESTEKYSCEYHEALVTALQARDSVLSFNYDTLIDRALRSKGGNNRWDPSSSYVVPISSGTDIWECKNTTPGRKAKKPIQLLKLHGSLNWVKQEDNIQLTSPTSNSAEFYIIPPAWNKPITEDPIFSKIWKEARIALRKASLLVVIGYSVPETDMLSQALLRVEATARNAEQLKYLIIAHFSFQLSTKNE